jgi:uncharacterized protein YkwD
MSLQKAHPESGRVRYSLSLMRKALGTCAGLLLFAAIGCGPGAEGRSTTVAAVMTPVPLEANSAEFETELLRLVNAHRMSLGLPTLEESSELTSVARDHSVDMIAQRYFDHVSPVGLTAGGRLRLAGVTWTSVGENLAEGLSTPGAVMEAWLSSPAHRENLERGDWTTAGVGVAVGEEGRVVTQLFLRP